MTLTSTLNLPEAIVRAVAQDSYHRGAARYTVTQLVAPPRQVALVRQHWDELEEDAADRIWALLGSVAHEILRRADIRDALTEEQLSTEVAGVRVSGQFDRMILLPDETLQGYKLTSAWALLDGVKPEWVAQLNCYAELLRQHSFHPQRLQIVAILRDWSKPRAKREPQYPQQGVALLEVPLWSRDEAMTYLRERVQLHEAARSELPLCTAEERWARPDRWAVHKGDNKRAFRVLDTPESAADCAAAAGAAYSVRYRPGESVRCADYCLAAAVCTQWRDMQGPNDGATETTETTTHI